MVLEEFKRYWNSKFTYLLLLILTLIVGISTFSTFLEKMEWKMILESADSTVNLDVINDLVMGHTGTYFFESIMFRNIDFFMIFWIVVLIGFGINIGANTFSTLYSSYGSIIMTRMPYKSYLKQTLIAQVLYMISFILFFFLIIFTIFLIIGGGGFQISPISIYKGTSITMYILTLFGLIFFCTVCVILMVIIASLSPIFLKNKYIIQFLPFSLTMGGYIISYIFGNMNDLFAKIVSWILLESSYQYLLSFIANKSYTHLINAFYFPIILGVISLVLYKINVSKLGEDYLC